ncbi:hypothetical protein [Luteimonas salinilitoris]|uniref:Uncharacterized protein n=1 Tax=Luteimonas salinilitoris TaxID=3237697 RepID=A0ABV4HXU1_9GAMM
MKRIRIEINASRRGIRFDVPGTRMFKSGGFDLQYSFDTSTSDRGLLSMGLGLLAPIIDRNVPGEIEIVLPQPMPEADVLAWRRYHMLPSRIHVRTATTQHKPLARSSEPSGNSPIGLLYGGGKDSVAALVLAEQLYPNRPRDLLRMHWSAKSPERHREAFESHVLPTLGKRTSFEYFSVSSTMHAEVIDRADAASIHLARYLCSFIPYIEARHPHFLCHGYDALEFHGSAYRRAHPQVLRYIDSVYRDLGVPTTIRSLCFALPPKLGFGMIAKLRPDLVPAIYMCESLDARWCYKCRKCFTYGILCLAYAVEAEGFDLQRMFNPAGSYMTRIAAQLERTDSSYTPLELADLLAYPAHFQAVSGWGEDVVRGARVLKLPTEATSLLERTFLAIRSHSRLHMDELWIQAAAYEGGTDFARGLRTIGERHDLGLLDLPAVGGTVKGKNVRYLMFDIE